MQRFSWLSSMSYIIFKTGLSARDAGRTGICQLSSMSFVFFHDRTFCRRSGSKIMKSTSWTHGFCDCLLWVLFSLSRLSARDAEEGLGIGKGNPLQGQRFCNCLLWVLFSLFRIFCTWCGRRCGSWPRTSTSGTEILELSSISYVFILQDFLHVMREKVWELDKEIRFKDKDFVFAFYELCVLCTGLSARDEREGVGAGQRDPLQRHLQGLQQGWRR